MNIPRELTTKINALKTPYIIAISGLGGSGKSTLAKSLSEIISAPVIGTDSFQKEGAFDTKYKLWEIMDFSRFEDEVLKPFINKEPIISYGHFDPKQSIISETREVNNNGKLIVEGVGLFCPDLINYFTYKIWIDCPIEIAIARGKKRDKEENQSPTDELWEGIWKDNDLQYIDTFKPKVVADFVFSIN